MTTLGMRALTLTLPKAGPSTQQAEHSAEVREVGRGLRFPKPNF